MKLKPNNRKEEERHLHSSGRSALEIARANGADAMDEYSAKRTLRDLGITTPNSICFGPFETELPELESLRAPYVLKALSNRVIHKSDLGAVRLGLATIVEIENARREISIRMKDAGESLTGFLLEEMIGSGTELVIGGTIDAALGPMIMIGAGGIYTEIMKDVSFRLCPIDKFDAVEMVNELKMAPILRGARGRSPIDLRLITDALLTLGGAEGFFTLNCDLISEFDLNPVIVSQHGLIAVDARIGLRNTLHGRS